MPGTMRTPTPVYASPSPRLGVHEEVFFFLLLVFSSCIDKRRLYRLFRYRGRTRMISFFLHFFSPLLLNSQPTLLSSPLFIVTSRRGIVVNFWKIAREECLSLLFSCPAASCIYLYIRVYRSTHTYSGRHSADMRMDRTLLAPGPQICLLYFPRYVLLKTSEYKKYRFPNASSFLFLFALIYSY